MLIEKITKTLPLLKKLTIIISIFLLIICILPRCAKIVTPTGGAKDTLAPVLIRSNPAMNSINFKGNKVILTFNEIVQLKDIQKKLAVSPPMIKKPELLQRGKNVEIRFKDTLKDNTTYTIYFADAIVDNNEGNPINNFEFAFSTGNSIDSLTLSGVIKNAFTLLPEENVFVMLYKDHNDSVPIKQVSQYLTRSNKHGLFIFKNLQSCDYKIFALKDNNSNYKFDQINEDIAFQNELIKKEMLKEPLLLDTSRHTSRDINLLMFKENNRFQARLGFSRSKRRKLALTFTKKPEGQVLLTPLNFKVDNEWYLTETNRSKDSLIYWITNDKINALDTLLFKVSYFKTDSLQQLKPKLDTLKFIYTEKEVVQKRKKNKDKTEKKIYLNVTSNIKNSQIAKPNKPFELTFPIPLEKIDESLISVTNLKDSSKIENIKLGKDSINPRLYRFNHAWESDVTYKLEALPGAFISLDSIANDTIKIQFKGANPDNFGILNFNLLNFKNVAIIELLNENKSQVIERLMVNPDEKVALSFIDAGKYTLRFIEDSNLNGEWDTGWYLKKIQPERIYYYDEGKSKGVLTVRANWESEITFDFNK